MVFAWVVNISIRIGQSSIRKWSLRALQFNPVVWGEYEDKSTTEKLFDLEFKVFSPIFRSINPISSITCSIVLPRVSVPLDPQSGLCA